MEWMITNSQIQSTFSLLGYRVGDTYHVNEACVDGLKEILKKLSTEDRVHRQYRRAIGFSQLIKKDLLPLLCIINGDEKIMDLVVRILGNLTTPVECLLDVDCLLKTDTGRTMIYEINWLLTSCKEAFLDARTTRAVLDYVKRILDKDTTFSPNECESIYHCFMLFRNILHIPEVRGGVPGKGVSHHNQIIWNLFTQNMDKVLVQLMVSESLEQWVLSLVQFIALLYKDQHFDTLQKALNQWVETSISDSSEDDESNTSPPEQYSMDSCSSNTTFDPTSDSSDNGRSRSPLLQLSETARADSPETICNINNNKNSRIANNKQGRNIRAANHNSQSSVRKYFISDITQGKKYNSDTKSFMSVRSWTSSEMSTNNSSRRVMSRAPAKLKCASSEASDCGYGTQIENQDSISTSSNDDDAPSQKPIHQKPSRLIQKRRYPNGKSAPMLPHEKTEWRRKKLSKRSKTNIMNVKALLHHTPTDEDVTHLMKEFTVDFLLKGYAPLVQKLRAQTMNRWQPHVDTSHFFWLVTFFLKFAAQIELDLVHVRPVISFDVVTYLTYEGVNECEKLELAKVQTHEDLTAHIRRMSLVVTALREFIHAVDLYKKTSNLSEEDEEYLVQLHNQMCSTENLKHLFVLLIRRFDPSIQSKQYLQDVIVTHHMFLVFLENSSDVHHSLPSKRRRSSITDHINLFASSEIMEKYGLLLENYEENGEFVNNCIFTMMHHVAGDINRTDTLFQPSILKTFFKILESGFGICDDWSDLIEFIGYKCVTADQKLATQHLLSQDKSAESFPNTIQQQDDYRNFNLSFHRSEDTVVEVNTESGNLDKTNNVVMKHLMKQEMNTVNQFDASMKYEQDYDNYKLEKMSERTNDDKLLDEIKLLRDHLINIKKRKILTWLQQSLLEVCHAKLYLSGKCNYFVEPIAYYYTLMEQSIPLVAWNSEQNDILLYQPFVLLLHKLGFHLSSDTGKLYPRIPNFWTTEILYSVAQKLGSVHSDELKFDALDLQIDKSSKEPASSNSPDALFNMSSTKRIGFTPGLNLKTNWMSMEHLTKTPPDLLSFHEDTELSCVIGDADLTQMCVSDEESTGPLESAE